MFAFYLQVVLDRKLTVKHTKQHKVLTTVCLKFTHSCQKIYTQFVLVIAQHQDRISTFDKDIPALQEIVSKTWKKEDELRTLKSELAALDRKMRL